MLICNVYDFKIFALFLLGFYLLRLAFYEGNDGDMTTGIFYKYGLIKDTEPYYYFIEESEEFLFYQDYINPRNSFTIFTMYTFTNFSAKILYDYLDLHFLYSNGSTCDGNYPLIRSLSGKMSYNTEKKCKCICM